MSDRQTIATYDARAQDYATMVQTAEPDAQLRAFIDAVAPGGRVLDWGCGPGTASAHMIAAGLLPDAVDASAGMIAVAKTRFGIDARLAVFDDLDADAAYDGVWANFSLLHAPREALPRHLAAVARALRPGGVFHIGMKTGDGAGRDRIKRLYTFVGVTELQDLLAEAGLTVTETTQGEGAGFAGPVEPWVICRACKDG